MRTAGQGQAAVPRERDHRRRMNASAWAHHSGSQDKILRTVTTVERYPDAFSVAGKGIRFYHGRVLRTMVFSAQKWGACVSPKSK